MEGAAVSSEASSSAPKSGFRRWLFPAAGLVVAATVVTVCLVRLLPVKERASTHTAGSIQEVIRAPAGPVCGQKAWFNADDPTQTRTGRDILMDPKTSFPENFLWGGATAAYQIEGKSVCGLPCCRRRPEEHVQALVDWHYDPLSKGLPTKRSADWESKLIIFKETNCFHPSESYLMCRSLLDSNTHLL